MERFYGEVGYVMTKEVRPGVYEEQREERYYYGNVKKMYLRWGGDNRSADSGSVNEDITPTNQINILADDFAFKNVGAIRYVKWMGVYWKVTNFEISHPRILLTLGGVYNGKKVTASS